MSSPGDAFRDRFYQVFEDVDPDDAALVEQVARTLDRIAELDAQVEEEGLTLTGARGQRVTHPSLQESRRQRETLAKLLRELGFSEDHGPKTDAQRQRAAAMSRWREKRPA